MFTLHQLFMATVNLISGSVMHCVTLTCPSRHYENMEESVRTRIAQIAPNAIQEIDRKAQIVHTNEPSFSSARLFIISETTSNCFHRFESNTLSFIVSMTRQHKLQYTDESDIAFSTFSNAKQGLALNKKTKYT